MCTGKPQDLMQQRVRALVRHVGHLDLTHSLRLSTEGESPGRARPGRRRTEAAQRGASEHREGTDAAARPA